jgi:hypothetical protein
MVKLGHSTNAKADKVEREPLIKEDGGRTEYQLEPKKIQSEESLDRTETIWKIFSIFVVGTSLWVTYTLKDFAHWSATNLPTSAKFSDLIYVVTLSIFIYFYRSLFRMIIYKPIYNGLEGRHFGEERDQRAQKVVKWIHDAIYYSVSAIFIYSNYRNTPLIGPLLGGNGDSAQLFKNMPNLPDPQEFPYLKEYYLIQMSAHFCTLVEQVLFKRDEAKYYEYFLHHFLSFILILNSYLQHELLLGTVVLLTHDITDVFLASGRSLEAYYKPKGTSCKSILLYAIYTNTVVMWIYFRIFVFTCVPIYRSFEVMGSWGEVWAMIAPGYYFSFTLLLVLFILDSYWAAIMIGIIYNALTKKEYKNNYDPKILKKK